MGECNYLDYVIILATTFEEHLEGLEPVFSRLKQNNLKLKTSKCEFLKAVVTCLGHLKKQSVQFKAS